MNSTFIIAEAGVNHNGSLELAHQLIDVAVAAGADAVKFQTFQAQHLVGQHAPKAQYQQQTTDASESQFEMIRKLELSVDAHQQLKAYCEQCGIEFMSTPFDSESVDLLVNLGVKRLKIPSGEITSAPLILQMAQTGLPLIVSSGMATLGEMETALSVLAYGYTHTSAPSCVEEFAAAYHSAAGQQALQEKVTLLQCTTEYPAPAHALNLRVMDTFKTAFGLPVGLSDHSQGIHIPIAAVALGAQVIEKHFTLDRTLPGPDHQASLEPQELTAMVRAIREVESALGSGRKMPDPVELKNRPIARKSLVAARQIRAGECFTKENLTLKRPATGISPLFYWEYLGKTAQQEYAVDDLIQP